MLCADVAGYMRLMARDEGATHSSYKNCLNEIVRPAVDANHGRIVKSTGDGFIAVFDSVVHSVLCAAAIQEQMARRDTMARPGDRLRFRIGINVGDILIEDDDVYGDGVNVAARLQTLAEPGGVCASALVRDQVRGKLPFEFESLGPKRVKKTDEPIHAFAIHLRAARDMQSETGRNAVAGPPSFRKLFLIGIATAVVISAGALAIWRPDAVPWPLTDLVASEEPAPLPLPAKPSLVVLPFKNIGPDPAQEYFADGITEDIITDLARISGLFVIARNSSFAYKAKAVDMRKVGRDLGVRYVLEGSVQKANDVLRISAQLVDATTGGNVWASRFDRKLSDVFKIQDEISTRIVSALSVEIKGSERSVAQASETMNMDAYDAFLRGWYYYRRDTYADYERAVTYFQRAIELDPDFAKAHAALAGAYLSARTFSWTNVEEYRSPLQTLLNARMHEAELLAKARQEVAQALARPSSLAYRAIAEILIFERRHDEALAEISKAIALDPGDADNLALQSIALTWAGRAREAAEPLRTAMRLNPNYPPIYLCHYGTALFTQGRYEESQKWLKECAAGNPTNHWPYIFLIAAQGHLGQMRDVSGERKKLDDILLRQRRSPFTVKEARSRMPYRYPADLDRLLIGLHKAGVPNTLLSDR